MNVSEATKNAYRENSIQKEVRIYFPDLDLTIGTGQIDYESMELVESLSESESIEFVGCISSSFKITVHKVSESLKNERIFVYISSGNTEEIPLFHGIVDDVSISADKSHKTLKCYDELYTIGNIDIADWYKSIEFPTTIGRFRNQLFNYLGFQQEPVSLPNDGVSIEKQYSPNTMKALDAIMSICQINGVFGIVNRENKFEYRLAPKSEAAEVTEAFEFQKTLDYQEYVVNPVDKLTIRQTDQDEGVSYGEGDNNYIIQGNMFTLNLDEETVLEIAENIYPNVEGFYYVPFKSDNNGLPWIEVGKDVVSYQAYDYDNSTEGNPVYKTLVFFVLSRTLSGLQNLRDSYSAEGDEFQRVFITDLQSKVETIVEKISEIVGELEDYSLNYVSVTNAAKVVVSDGDEVSIARTRFLVTKETQVMINIEILLDCETTVDGIEYNDLVLKARYYYDESLIDTRQPIETYTDGKHILKLFYLLYIEDVLSHSFEIRLVADGGSATVEIGNALIVLSGQGLVQDTWDGRLEIRQAIPIGDVTDASELSVVGIDEAITVDLQTPIPIMAEDEFELMEMTVVNGVNVFGIEEEVSFVLTEVPND